MDSTASGTELTELARQHAVAVRAGSRFVGSGFLLTDDLAVSCAHVVADTPFEIGIEVGGRWYGAAAVECLPARPGSGDYYAFPDLALIRLSEPVPGLDGVWLAEHAPAAGSTVLALGYSTYTTEAGPAVDSLHLRVTGRSGPLLRVADDRVVPGMSGALVLDPASGRVCGMVKATRDQDGVQGGWIVPCEVLAEHTAQRLAGVAVHRPGTRWFDLASGRAALSRTLFGTADPIGEPPAPPPDPRPSWWLDTRNQVVPFTPRPELDELLGWCGDWSGPAVQLVTGAGGSGKTRLAMRLCRTLRQQGWLAGFLPQGRAEGSETVTAAVTAGYRVLLVLDYAETRAEELRTLLQGLAGALHAVRVLLLARSGGPWWTTVTTEFEQITAPEPVRLSPLAERLGTRHVVAEAWRAFNTAVLNRPAPELPPRLVGFDSSGDALTLHALALDEVLIQRDGTWSTAPDPLRAILGHEQRYWRRMSREHGLTLARDDVRLRQTLMVPTLFAATDGEQAATALQAVAELSMAATSEARPAARLLRQLYPHAELYWAPMQPDRLGETLLLDVVAEADTVQAATQLLIAMLSQCDTEQAEHALVVLIRTAHPFLVTATERTQRLAAVLPALVVQQPRWFSTAAVTLPLPWELVAALTAVVQQADADLLWGILTRLPQSHNQLKEFAVLAAQELVNRLEAALPRWGWARSQPAEAERLVQALSELANRLEAMGEFEEAARVTEQAANRLAKLARADPRRYQPAYADHLHALGLRLYNLGYSEPARHICESAAREWEDIFRQDVRFAPQLVDALLSLGQIWSETARGDRALSAFKQATGLAVELIKTDRSHAGRLVRCLYAFSVQLSREGKHPAAVEQAKACLIATRLLETESPEELSAVADCMENYSRTLAAVGQMDHAIERKAECAQIRRRAVDMFGVMVTFPPQEPPILAAPPTVVESLVITLYGLAYLLELAGRGEEGKLARAAGLEAHTQLTNIPGDEGGNYPYLEWSEAWLKRIWSSDGFFRD
ncbi:trypsin-like peptidase domain-containing protein [Streptomyces cinerochromogenes]|uniref:trypsin-like peptidase domain-containing protein n=1 Tax=Streptomyces cinerochromogenes TaxID=66422 RepID=UPI0036BECD80